MLRCMGRLNSLSTTNWMDVVISNTVLLHSTIRSIPLAFEFKDDLWSSTLDIGTCKWHDFLARTWVDVFHHSTLNLVQTSLTFSDGGLGPYGGNVAFLLVCMFHAIGGFVSQGGGPVSEVGGCRGYNPRSFQISTTPPLFVGIELASFAVLFKTPLSSLGPAPRILLRQSFLVPLSFVLRTSLRCPDLVVEILQMYTQSSAG